MAGGESQCCPMVDHKFGLMKYDGDVPWHVKQRDNDDARKKDVIMQLTNKRVDG